MLLPQPSQDDLPTPGKGILVLPSEDEIPSDSIDVDAEKDRRLTEIMNAYDKQMESILTSLPNVKKPPELSRSS